MILGLGRLVIIWEDDNVRSWSWGLRRQAVLRDQGRGPTSGEAQELVDNFCSSLIAPERAEGIIPQGQRRVGTDGAGLRPCDSSSHDI